MVWIPDFLPFTDYPVHLSLIQVSDIPGRAAPIISEQYETQWFTPYSLTYLTGRLFAMVFPLETTGRILLSLYLVLTPLTFLRLLRSFSKPGYLALAAFPLLMNFNVSWGFLPFLLSIPLIFEALVQLVLWRKPSSFRSLFISSLIFVALFFTHLFSLLLAVCLGFIYILAEILFHDKKAWSKLFAMIPAVFLALFWRFTLQFSQSDAFFLAKGMRFASISHKVKFFPTFIISGDPGWFAYYFFGIFVLVLILRCLPEKTNGITADSNESPQSTSDTFKLCGVIFSGICFLYLICPYNWLTAVWLHNRLAFMIPMLGILLIPTKSRLTKASFQVLMALLVCWFSIQFTTRHMNFSREAAAGIELIRKLPPGGNLRYIASNTRSIFADHEPYGHFGHYYQIQQNGNVYNPFATLVHLPVRYTDAVMQQLDDCSPRVQHHNGQLSADLMYDRNDYFLIRLSPLDTPERIHKLFKQTGQPLPTMIYSTNPWILLKKQDVIS